MRLREFQGESPRTIDAVAQALQGGGLGTLQRLGGKTRVYDVTDHAQKAAIFAIAGTLSAVALAYTADMGDVGVTTIYYWKTFDFYRDPDYQLDLPIRGNLYDMVETIVDAIKHPQMGNIPVEEEIHEDRELTEARRSTEDEFIGMVRNATDINPAYVTWVELDKVAKANDVQIPGSIRFNKALKVDSHHWNLSGGDASNVEKDNAKLGDTLGGPIEQPENDDPEFQNMLQLAKVKSLKPLAAKGRLHLTGRKPNGAFFKVPGVELVLAQLERMLSNQLQGAGEQNMQEQYEQLHDKVKLVAGGQSNFIKSLLIMGAPSSGKTFTVMKTIKELGLVEGKDYVVKKGRITTVAMYRTLIEQVNGMVIFDDCDSVVDDKNAVNMLKGALDTDPVREISYDTARTMNTAAMEAGDRDEVVDAISRILRNKPAPGDLERFEHLLKAKKKARPGRDDQEDMIDDTDDEDYGDDLEGDENAEKLGEIQSLLMKRLPNKIDFKGRVIFISNMDESEWDGAIITRAFTINMNFTSSEMLDYIDKVKSHIKTPGLSEEDKQEVMDYLRALWTSGKLKRDVNFRLVQQAFDLRLTDNWKKMLAML